jgi:hypothetical protein
MTEIRTVTTLRSKRAEITSTIAHYEMRIAQARADTSHVIACIALFEDFGEPGAVPPHVDARRLFARGDLMILSKQALASGPKTTREPAFHVMAINLKAYRRNPTTARAVRLHLRQYERLRHARPLARAPPCQQEQVAEGAQPAGDSATYQRFGKRHRLPGHQAQDQWRNSQRRQSAPGRRAG